MGSSSRPPTVRLLAGHGMFTRVRDRQMEMVGTAMFIWLVVINYLAKLKPLKSSVLSQNPGFSEKNVKTQGPLSKYGFFAKNLCFDNLHGFIACCVVDFRHFVWSTYATKWHNREYNCFFELWSCQNKGTPTLSRSKPVFKPNKTRILGNMSKARLLKTRNLPVGNP